MTHKITLVLSIATIVIFLAITPLLSLQADDYCQYLGVRDNGAVAMFVERYTAWSGRASHTALIGVMYTLFGVYAPIALPFLLILGAVGAIYYALPQNSNRLPLSILLSGLLLAALGETIWQGVFWVAGSSTYFAPLISAIVLFGLLRRQSRTPAIVLVGVITGGFNESIAIGAGVICLYWFLGDNRHGAIAAIIGLLFGWLIVVLSPGSAVRADMLAVGGPPKNLIEALTTTFVATFASLFKLIAETPLIALSAFLIGAAVFARASARPRLLLMVLLIGFLAVGAVLFPAAWRAWAGMPRVQAMAMAIWFATFVFAGATAPRLSSRILVVAAFAAIIHSVGLYAINAPVLASNPNNFTVIAEIDDISADWVAPCAAQI